MYTDNTTPASIQAHILYDKLLKYIYKSPVDGGQGIKSFISDNFGNSVDAAFKRNEWIPVPFEVNIYKNDFFPYDIRHCLLEGVKTKKLNVPGLPREVLPIISEYLGHRKNLRPQKVNLKYHRHIYLASLNENYALEMVMYLHQYVHESINQLNIAHNRIISNKVEKKEFKSSELYVDPTLQDRAYRDAKMELLNYLISMHEESDPFVGKFPTILDDKETFLLKKLYSKQEKLFQSKAYPELFDLLKNCKLVFSARTLARDQSFVAYCKAQDDSFVNLYISNAIHEMKYKCEHSQYDDVIERQQEEKAKVARDKNFVSSLSMFVGISAVAVGLCSAIIISRKK